MNFIKLTTLPTINNEIPCHEILVNSNNICSVESFWNENKGSIVHLFNGQAFYVNESLEEIEKEINK